MTPFEQVAAAFNIDPATFTANPCRCHWCGRPVPTGTTHECPMKGTR